MMPENYLSLLPLFFSLASIIIALLSYVNNEKTRKLAVLSFRKQLMETYLKWRDQLETIELDPPPGDNYRVYTEMERRKIRDYWPKVALIELELLNSVDRKLIKHIWIEWKRYLKEGIGHRSILQEFCYYEKYEDAGNVSTKKELIKIVKEVYQKFYSEEINIDKLLEERNKYTR